MKPYSRENNNNNNNNDKKPKQTLKLLKNKTRL